ncbi:MAG: ABC transporter ATP-binding protein [Actinomycetaceae bacterium]|nr:ABC transporter ATP-binding protein [Actinomycetaceae bacterium]
MKEEKEKHEAAAMKEATFSSVLMRFMATVRPQLIVGVIVTAISSIFTFMPYYLLADITMHAIDEGVPQLQWLMPRLIIAGICAILGRLLFGIGTGICHYADAQFRVNVRTMLAEHISRMPLGWFSNHSSGEIKQAANDDVLGMHQMVGHAPADFTASIISPLLALGYLFVVDWRVALILIVYIMCAFSISMFSMMGDFETLNNKYNASLAEVSNATVEMVDGIEVVKTYGKQKASRRFLKAVDDYIDITYVWAKKTGAPFSMAQMLMSPAVILIVFTLIFILFIHMDWISVSSAAAFLILGTGVPQAINNIMASAGFVRNSATSAEHLGSIMDVEPLKEPDVSREIPENDIDVEVDNVVFSYTEESRPALQNVSLNIKPGTVTALVGSSGSGKTTLARLIPRFWDVGSGAIKIGDIDVRDAQSLDVLSKCGIVFQDTQLLRSSIHENISLARPHASREDVIEAAKAANIHERIMELPNGYESVIGSSGVNLSGGEAQRIAIARTIMADAPILILDEATAHADPENERVIQEALGRLAQGRTTIVIAHRLNTIRHAHNIVVLENGHICEQGTHEELMEKNGAYAHMWQCQNVEEG